jgi:hypothetical protein
MNKVQVKGKCNYCNGEAYLFSRNAISHSGDPYEQYEPCGYCQGSGEEIKWIALDLLTILATSFEEEDLSSDLMEDENDYE